jgi:uncharacterized membrane protein YfhO
MDWDFNAGQTVLIEERELAQNNISLNGNGSGSVRVVSYKPNKIELDVKSDSKAVLVSSESYYPGWRATIGGQPTEILLVNTAFRGVQIPEGNHRLVFTFSSTTFRTGSVISSLMLITLLLLYFFKARR